MSALIEPDIFLTDSVDDTCRERSIVVAYLDGELDAAESERFETHLKNCAACTLDLSEQRRVLCALSFALTRSPGGALPSNFAATVVARARTDMRGVRASNERGRALKICALLFGACLLLLGVAAKSFTYALLMSLEKLALSALRLVYYPLESLASAVAVVLRAVGREILANPLSQHFILLLIFAAALALLPLLIFNYHRAAE